MRLLISHIAIVGVAATLLSTLKDTTPSYATLTGPIRTQGKQGEFVSGTMFGAKVGPVKMSKSIAFIQFGKPIERTTSGIWIVVSAQLQAFNETTHVRAATITGTSGRMYRQSSRAQGALSEKSVQPGLPTKGVFVFELPESETSHMVLALSQQYAPQLADQLDILLEPDTSAPKAVLEIGKDGM